MTSPIKRRCSDRLYPPRLGPREREALLIEHQPGITAAELAEQLLDVTNNRAWQIIRRLETGRVRRER